MHIAKAVIGALIAGFTALAAVLVDGGAVTAYEWVAVILAALSTLGAVYTVPNADRPGGAPSPEDDLMATLGRLSG